jgi:aminoglycoside phosphotransferase family enzyme/predicted kinase
MTAPAAQTAFVRAMRQPAAYARLHPVTGPVRCIETHVSWVFLTGPYAYKVKKPLRLAFLDYSSMARRAMFCAEELRLNQRSAPMLYVDVVPIAGTPAAPRVGVAGAPPFEHALRMRQFDPDAELTQLLQRAAVSTGELAVFGAHIAELHAGAPRPGPDTATGHAAAVHRITLDNLDALADAMPAAAADAQRERLRRLIDGEFERVRELLERRRTAGQVRECHGDLHCGNVVRWQGALLAFDALEFDPALRWIDVASDLAFLTMDLATRGRAELRRALLQAWLEASGDFEALAVLPYFEAYRALVRAKVAALRSRQSPDTAESAMTQARRYLDWIEQRARRGPPLLVVMTGLSGSGKTWMAQRIAGSIDGLVVRSDIERKRLAGLRPLQSSNSPADGGLYTTEFNRLTYARLGDCAAHGLAGGEHLVIDAASLRHGEREQFMNLARTHAATLRIVHCEAPMTVLRQRLEARAAAGNDASEATVALLDRQPGYQEPFTDAERAALITVETADAASVAAALRSLRDASGPVQSLPRQRRRARWRAASRRPRPS